MSTGVDPEFGRWTGMCPQWLAVVKTDHHSNHHYHSPTTTLTYVIKAAHYISGPNLVCSYHRYSKHWVGMHFFVKG